jgi:hypothetical protein
LRISPKFSAGSVTGWVSGLSGFVATGSDMKGYSPRRGIGVSKDTIARQARRNPHLLPRPLRIVFRLHDLAVAHVDNAVPELRRLRIMRNHEHRLA